METAVGVILGALATILASRYYFLRSIHKSLGIYGLLNSFVFGGIAPDVRKQLHFRFKDREVEEVQQLVFLVANDGEKAISNVIEPLTIPVPSGVEILDASILHRYPDGLQAEIVVSSLGSNGSAIALRFPLLNKGEFFVVKLLLSGRLSLEDLTLSILADDLPRSLRVKELPPQAFEDRGHKFEWSAALAGVVVLLIPAWVCFCLYLIHANRPDLFPYPWSSFAFSAASLFLLVPSALVLALFAVLGLFLVASSVFGGEFPPSRGPRFPLPKELRRAVFPYGRFHFPSRLEEEEVRDATASGASDDASQNGMRRMRLTPRTERRR